MTFERAKPCLEKPHDGGPYEVELDDREWGKLMAIVSDAPWKIANPLLMAIGDQLRAQALAQNPMPTMSRSINADGKEHEQ